MLHHNVMIGTLKELNDWTSNAKKCIKGKPDNVRGKVTQKEEETFWWKLYIDAERKEQDLYVKCNSLGERFKSECGPTKQEKQDLLHTNKNK